MLHARPEHRKSTALNTSPVHGGRRHIYQRTASYFVHSKAGSIVFSNIRRFASDLQTVNPDHLVCVPLVLDTLHSRVRPGPATVFARLDLRRPCWDGLHFWSCTSVAQMQHLGRLQKCGRAYCAMHALQAYLCHSNPCLPRL